jgi:ACR3 family arsenite efflux pump ArsB
MWMHVQIDFQQWREINQQNAQLILRLIYYWSITPTCFGYLIEAIIRESKILEGYKAIGGDLQECVMQMCFRRGVVVSHHDENT